MIAKNLVPGDWFHWEDDWRIFSRLAGETEIIEGREYILVIPLQPTANMGRGYIPATDEVTLYRESFLRLN